MAEKVNCDFCGKNFHIRASKLKRQKNKFCSRECYWKYKGLNSIKTKCFRCGKDIKKPPSKASERSFCSHSCKMKTLNEELNPIRMTEEVKEKLRQAHLGKGEGKTYTKVHGRHTHRVVAEQMLGRPLKPGEVVHHIDEDKLNNLPENLMVFPSQKEHAAWHMGKRYMSKRW